MATNEKKLPLLPFAEISNYMRIAKRNLMSLSILAFFYFNFFSEIKKISLMGIEFKPNDLSALNNSIQSFILISLIVLLIQYILLSINYIKIQLNKLPTGGNLKFGFFSKIQARVFQKDEKLEDGIRSILNRTEDENQKIFNIKAYVEAHTKEILIPFYKLFYREQIGLRVLFDVLLPILMSFISIAFFPKLKSVYYYSLFIILIIGYCLWSIFQIQIRNRGKNK